MLLLIIVILLQKTEMNADEFFGLHVWQHEQQQQQQARERKQRVYKPRLDPGQTMGDSEFKRHFRFSKESVGRITDLLEEDLVFESNRGLPVPPVQQVCIALNSFAGAHFQRISGWCGGVSQNAARLCLVRVTNALVRRKNQFIFLPDVNQMEETAQRMFDKFKLPRFAMAVDGMQVRFNEAPRKIPANKTKQQFWCRKQFYSINTQVVSNDEVIYDIDCGWPGSTHDARVWNRSEVKRWIEEQRRFKIVGDSGYPISEVLIKPYSTQEAGQDRRKRLFNRRLSGARTVMSECIYGVWKRRFPILKGIGTALQLSQRIIVATAVLHNIARMWSDEDPEDDEEEEQTDDDDDEGVFVVQDGAPVTIRLRGQIERDRLCQAMPGN